MPFQETFLKILLPPLPDGRSSKGESRTITYFFTVMNYLLAHPLSILYPEIKKTSQQATENSLAVAV